MPIFLAIKHTAAALLAVVTMAACCAVHAATISSGTIARPEGPRSYLLGQAANPAPGKRPLVILLHGHGASAAMAFGKGKIRDPAAAWLDIADRENLLLIAPEGATGSDNRQGWNDCRADAATNPATDDVGLLGALIDKAVAEHNADAAQVYITGISNGGGMTYRAAIELKHPVAAIAVLSMPMAASSRCAAPTRPLPVLFTHGTSDKIVPYAGGPVGNWVLKGRGTGVSAEETVRQWRELAKLPDTPQVTRLPKRNSSDPTSATRYVWGQDPAQLQVVFLKIDKGGHTQPSITRRFAWPLTILLGAQNSDVEFAEEAWSFFKTKRAADAQ